MEDKDKGTPLEKIDTLAGLCGDAYRTGAALAGAYQAALDKVHEKYSGAMQTAARRIARLEESLGAAIRRNPGLFERPRTRVMDGVRFGMTKGKGKVVLPVDEEKLVRAIRQKHPDLADALIKTTEKPIKDALSQNLNARDLKALGIEVEDATDSPVVKPVDREAARALAKAIEAAGSGKGKV